jgi:hypothetical protein
VIVNTLPCIAADLAANAVSPCAQHRIVRTATAIGLVFDPRFIDFPFAALTMAAVPFAAITLLNAPNNGIRPMAEAIFAAVFLGAAIYTGINEGPSNWQSLWTCADYVLLAATLWRVRDCP